MSGYIGIGAFGVFLMIHLIALIVTAAYAPLLGGELPLDCTGIPAFACDGPFEGIAKAINKQSIGFLELPLLAGSVISLLFQILIIDYPIFEGGGEIASAVWLMIRAVGWTMLAGALVALGIQFFG